MRNIILGIDGVPYKLIDNLSNKGIMPNFKELKNNYSFNSMKSSIPHISSVSWSSIITGKNPGEHGIYGFTEIIDNTYTLSFPNFNALKCKPFWQNQNDKKHIIINVPSTYPAKSLNGIHIAGFVALDLEKAVYPKTLLPKLKEINYEIDVDSSIAHQQSMDVFLDELFKVLNIRKKIFEFLWEERNWDTFMPVITSSDRLGHFLWYIYEDSSNIFHHRFIDFFKEIDNIIGNIMNKMKEDDTLIILSDHGMERIFKNVNLNTYLEQEKFLILSENLRRYNRLKKGTKAFILEPGRIYLNKKGKYPNGTVSNNDEHGIIEELKTLFYDLKFNNQKVIRHVYRKDEIYKGKMIEKAPDLVLIENNGFNLKAGIGKDQIFESDSKFTGMHNDNAFFFINKDIDTNNLTVENIVGLIEGN